MASEFVLGMYPEANACLQSNRKSELDGIDATASKNIPLQQGYPPCKMVDRVSEIMKEACQKRLRKPRLVAICFTMGFAWEIPYFRAQLAKFLTDQYGYDVRNIALDIYLQRETTGYVWSHIRPIPSLHHVLPSRHLVFAEEPSYYLALEMMEKDIKRKIIHVPLDTKGILPEDLESTVKQFYPKEGFVPSKERLYWSMVYLISCFQNPTGACLSEDRCKAVVAIARKYHLLVVSDDLYGPLHWSFDTDGRTPSHAPKPLKYFDREEDEGFFGKCCIQQQLLKDNGPWTPNWMDGGSTGGSS
ncbi:hypothetical protein BSL78_17982 [Apostichopus japonicus]|uniref:Aminotransferase class I/classII large domain-containing protein n=1 Tax=Stichopus japonicus TaxID=307972 RepID=A0A2G8KB04_STIJA|nr:hypothetical protein BSL78_17982 [Apostichopus japonicus]